MATIQTSITMADNITSTLFNVTNALNLTVSAFQDVQSTASDAVDITSFDAIREYINAATIATQQFESELDNIKPKAVPVEIKPVWSMESNIETFNNTGVERYNLEIGSLNDMLGDVLASQNRISEKALNMELLPSNASQDIVLTSQRIEELGERITTLQGLNIPSMDDSSLARVNSEFEAIRTSMNSILNLQGDMNTAVAEGDFSKLSRGYNQLNHVAVQVEQRVRSNTAAIQEMNNIEWRTPQNIEIFDDSGVERFKSEITSAMNLMSSLSNKQSTLTQQAMDTLILPPNAIDDIESMNSRITGLKDKLQELSSVQLNGVGAEQANAEIEHLRQTLSQTLQVQEQFSSAMGKFDTSGANNAFNQLNNLIDNTERNFRDRLMKIKEMDLQDAKWATPQNIEIFAGNSVERYKQEIQSANDLMNRLSTTQQSISRQATNTSLFPANMISDINGINSRIGQLQGQLEKVSQQRIDDIGAGKASNDVEALRQQLSQALQVQEELNSAMTKMDVSAANTAYNRLNSIVDSTERNIRDNVVAQEQFNQTLQHGQSAANGLQNEIKRAAAAYLSIQGAEQVIEMSDINAQITARLKLVDDGDSVDEFKDKIFLAAQRSRADFTALSDNVAKLGLMASSAFSGNDELIFFAEQMNKQFTIGGSSIQESSNAMYQLTQAMASGVLQGDEFRSIMENAPLLAQSISESLGISIAELREMSSDGLITADVIKNALFMAAAETDRRFEEMPQTFAQVATGIKNSAYMAFQPVLERLNQIANSPEFQVLTANLIGAFQFMANVSIMVIDLITNAINMLQPPLSAVINLVQGVYESFVNNWSQVAPILLIVASAIAAVTAAILLYKVVTGIAAAAQWLLNTAFWACPLTWIVVAVIAVVGVIYALVAGINKAAGTSYSATGIIVGVFYWLGSVIANIFFGLLELVFAVINAIVNPFIQLANFIGNIFIDPVSSIVYLFQGMADSVLGVIEKIASAIDFICNSNMADNIANVRSGLKELADSVAESRGFNPEDFNAINELDLSVEGTLGWERFDNSDAYNAGYKAGENIDAAISEFDFANLFESNIPNPDDYSSTFDTSAYDNAALAGDVGKIKENTEKEAKYSEEDLKYLRDMAERDAINRFTTAEVSVSFGGVTNNVNSDMDLDGIVAYIGESVAETLESVAEGVHA